MAAGLLLVDKPPGVSSGEVLRRLKRLTGGLKLGHAGTLDPLASGLLLVLVGGATKLLPYLRSDKEYLAAGALGVATDSLDAMGELMGRRPVAPLDRGRWREVLRRFVGRGEQEAPALSAKKIDGERSYKLFRRGAPQRAVKALVEIYGLRLVEYDHPSFTVAVRCSAGTYIRSLLRDVGRALDAPATLYALRRRRVGPFRVEEARRELRGWRRRLRPAAEAVAHLPAVRLSAAREKLARCGRELTAGGRGRQGLVRLMTARGELLAIGERGAGAIRIKRLIAN